MKRYYLSLLILFLLAAGFAPPGPVGKPTQVLLIGTHYLPADILRNSRQREMDQLVESLVHFRADRILLSVERASQEEDLLNQRLQAYEEGKQPLNRSVEEQLGLRLAANLRHKEVFGFLQDERFQLSASSAELQQFKQDAKAIEVAKQTHISDGSVIDYLAYLNHPSNLQHEHTIYVKGLSRVGAGTDYAGADLLADWYGYHARMFANLTQLSEGMERVILMVDSRHIPILQELIKADPDFQVVSVEDFLLAR